MYSDVGRDHQNQMSHVSERSPSVCDPRFASLIWRRSAGTRSDKEDREVYACVLNEYGPPAISDLSALIEHRRDLQQSGGALAKALGDAYSRVDVSRLPRRVVLGQMSYHPPLSPRSRCRKLGTRRKVPVPKKQRPVLLPQLLLHRLRRLGWTPTRSRTMPRRANLGPAHPSPLRLRPRMIALLPQAQPLRPPITELWPKSSMETPS